MKTNPNFVAAEVTRLHLNNRQSAIGNWLEPPHVGCYLIITWTPTVEQAGSVNEFTTQATDGAAWATNRFNVEVEA